MTGPKAQSVQIDVSSEDALAQIFAPDRLERALKRIRNKRDQDNLVAHPLKTPILLEYEEQLAEEISQQVSSGSWAPRPAYLCLAEKRSGTFRELSFPSLVDTVVGRTLIDALEPQITADDNGKVFCGRSHSSTTREPGDYERWFQLWLRYSAKIAAAARAHGFAYVFETDVSDFFASIDMSLARQFVAQRTGAHPVLISLLFYCLQSWLPRCGFEHCGGLPIENNDVSRLVAHCYLKAVDKEFLNRTRTEYLRWVDDTVIFVPSKRDALKVKEQHHMALRAVRLLPNSAKSAVLSVEAYESSRHRDMNSGIDEADTDRNPDLFEELVNRWYSISRTDTPNWDQITRRLYTLGRRLKSRILGKHVLVDLESMPSLTGHICRYLSIFSINPTLLHGLIEAERWSAFSVYQKIEVSKFLADAYFRNASSTILANFCVGRIMQSVEGVGQDYIKGLLLLVLYKHGNRSHRAKILKWANPAVLDGEMLRLFFAYVFICTGEIPGELLNRIRRLPAQDLELTLQLCRDARSGRLSKVDKLRKLMLTRIGETFTISATYLPLLRVIIECGEYRVSNERWLVGILSKYESNKWDPQVYSILQGHLRTLRS
jgi:hypothetical protein